jgi:ammonia channel protein AmtB
LACALGSSTNLNTKLDVFGVHGIGGLIGTIFAGVLAAGALSATADMQGGIFGCSKATRRNCRRRSTASASHWFGPAS